MVRAMLHDDYTGPFTPGGHGVRLDNDGRSSVPAGIGHVPEIPGVETPVGTVNPSIAVMERIPDGMSDSGNQRWRWITVVESTEAIGWEQRIEENDDSAVTVVLASFTILWPDSLPDIRESAQIRTLADNLLWPVTAVERNHGRVRLEVRRIESE